ncbi:hypothetical protein BD626DRAFT_179786 [Schizophyllum amplum]|uniref:Uncharacterized protein n=1 Tax=Schizophyllum amplum TaxID=97359 RepID=A0A550C212_9AGAR|nr:hypothetical protein BD626DRAFT_179786 [Auriculariopsis ampla]
MTTASPKHRPLPPADQLTTNDAQPSRGLPRPLPHPSPVRTRRVPRASRLREGRGRCMGRGNRDAPPCAPCAPTRDAPTCPDRRRGPWRRPRSLARARQKTRTAVGHADFGRGCRQPAPPPPGPYSPRTSCYSSKTLGSPPWRLLVALLRYCEGARQQRHLRVSFSSSSSPHGTLPPLLDIRTLIGRSCGGALCLGVSPIIAPFLLVWEIVLARDMAVGLWNWRADRAYCPCHTPVRTPDGPHNPPDVSTTPLRCPRQLSPRVA